MNSDTAQIGCLSIVVPVYMGRPFLDALYDRVTLSVTGICNTFELILVNDASPDDCWSSIKRICAGDSRVMGINLSRNFGQHYAITAGLTHATGDWIVVMDCDLQDRPEDIVPMIRKALEGFDSVSARRTSRQDTMLRCMQSKAFYALFGYLTDTTMDCTVANFGVYNRKVINAILSMRDHVRFFPTMVQWVGFRRAYFHVAHDERPCGHSSYSFRRLAKLAIENMIAFSDKPLRLCIGTGFCMAAFSFAVAAICLIARLTNLITVSGFTSLMISVWLVGGILLMSLGVVGVYVGKCFDQAKGRPIFIIADTANLKD